MCIYFLLHLLSIGCLAKVQWLSSLFWESLVLNEMNYMYMYQWRIHHSMRLLKKKPLDLKKEQKINNKSLGFLRMWWDSSYVCPDVELSASGLGVLPQTFIDNSVEFHQAIVLSQIVLFRRIQNKDKNTFGTDTTHLKTILF